MIRRLLDILLLVVALIFASEGAAGSKRLTLGDAIRIANDSSLTTFRYQNLYESGYWEWRSFKAGRLPSLALALTPVAYNYYFAQRYNYDENIDVFRSQKTYVASVGLAVTQNVDFLGGTLYLESDLEYLRNFGTDKSNQFSSIPVRIGYRQDLIGFNSFRWERRIEPVKYEKVKREFIFNMESVAEDVVTLFFDLAVAQSEYTLAEQNLVSCDTLYTLGERKFKIASISQADLLTLRLDKVNAMNSLENARISVKRARFALASYLGMDTDTELETVLPVQPAPMEVPLQTALEQARENNPAILGRKQLVLEAQRELRRNQAEARFNASVNASIGFNQVSNKIADAYRNPLRQDMVSVTLSVPLVDWGVRKGKVNMARSNLDVAEISERQEVLTVEEDVTITVNEFSTQQRMIASAVEALDLADMAYDQTLRRFMIGKADINSLTLARNRQQEANKNYITSLRNYWLSYYRIRKLTLYDFERMASISSTFDNNLGVR